MAVKVQSCRIIGCHLNNGNGWCMDGLVIDKCHSTAKSAESAPSASTNSAMDEICPYYSHERVGQKGVEIFVPYCHSSGKLRQWREPLGEMPVLKTDIERRREE